MGPSTDPVFDAPLRAKGAGTFRRGLIGTSLVVLAAAAMIPAVHWWHDRAYIGSTRTIALAWQCQNGIAWTNPETQVQWHAIIPATVDRSTDDNWFPTLRETRSRTFEEPYIPTAHATGRLHFDSARRATFTSDAGGAITLERTPKGAFFTLDCRSLPTGGG